MTANLLLAGCLLAGVTIGIALIMAHPSMTQEETETAGNVGVVVFLALVVVAALGGLAVFGNVAL